MIVKHDGDVHWSMTFGTLGESDRIILPGQDDCSVKVTLFRGNEGGVARDINYTTDETVYVIGGCVKLWQGDDEDSGQQLESDSCYHVRAGEKYNIRIIRDCLLLCVFSVAVGPLPEDE